MNTTRRGFLTTAIAATAAHGHLHAQAAVFCVAGFAPLVAAVVVAAFPGVNGGVIRLLE